MRNRSKIRKIVVTAFTMMYLFTTLLTGQAKLTDYSASVVTPVSIKSASDQTMYTAADKTQPVSFTSSTGMLSEQNTVYTDNKVFYQAQNNYYNSSLGNQSVTGKNYISAETARSLQNSYENSNMDYGVKASSLNTQSFQEENYPLLNNRIIRYFKEDITQKDEYSTKALLNSEAGILSSSNANLKYIELNKGDFEINFDPLTTEYWVGVPVFLNFLNVAAFQEDPSTQITINGNQLLNTNKYLVNLNTRPDYVIIDAKAQDGTVKSYTIHLSYVDLSLDKNILNVWKENSVNITLKDVTGNPIIGEKVVITNYNDTVVEGTTNSSGIFSASIKPNYGQEYVIKVRGYNYYGTLFALNADEGLVEVSVIGLYNNTLNDYQMLVRDSVTRKGWFMITQGTVARAIAKAGENIVQVVDRGNFNLNKEGYYIIKNVNVQAGQITKLNISAASEALSEVNYNFNYNGSAIKKSQLFMSLADDMQMGMGNTNESGNKRIYATPGAYKVGIQTYNENNIMMYLLKDLQVQNGLNNISNTWSTIDTGTLQFDITSPEGMPFTADGIRIGKWRIFLDNQNQVVFSKGSYLLHNITVNNYGVGGNTSYDFEGAMSPEEITIDSINVTNYSMNLNPKDISLKMYNNNVNLHPGDCVAFGVRLITQSDHILTGCNGFNSDMQVSIINPRGEIKDWGKWRFDYCDYYIEPADKAGTYTFNANGYLGQLYGDFSRSTDFTVAEPPAVTVNTAIARVKQTNQITITVMNNNIPMAGQYVELEGNNGWYGKGQTGSDGTVSLNINPWCNDSIRIHVGKYIYEQMLFALEDDTGIIEVEFKDINGVSINNFEVAAMSQTYWDDRPSIGTKAKVLARHGSNLLGMWSTDGNSYYIAKMVSVVPGEINSVTYDCSDPENEVVLADTKYLLDSSNIANSDIFFENQDISISEKTICVYMGSTDDMGNRKIYLQPGYYKARIIGKVANDEVLFLTKSDISINSAGTYSIGWKKEDTGTIQLDISGITQLSSRGINVDGFDVYLNNYDSQLRIDKGFHLVNGFAAAIPSDNGYVTYYYEHPNSTADEIEITDNPIDYNIDLGVQSIDINIYSESIRMDSNLNFGVNVLTNSGYRLKNIYNHWVWTDVSIQRPDGRTDYLGQQWFQDMNYYIDKDAPEGQYTINCKVDLGPQFGVKSITKTFNVSKPHISIDKVVLKSGVEDTVTLTATQNGEPLVGASVEIYGPGIKIQNQYTDAKGQLTVSIKPGGRGNFDINLNGYNFRSKLFAVNNDEGVIMVTAKDMQGNSIQSFNIKAVSQYSGESNDTNDYQVGVIAREGENELIISSGNNSKNSYYVFKKITVNPGMANIINLDMAQENLVQADLNFTMDGNPIDASYVSLEMENKVFWDANACLASTDKDDILHGTKRIYVTPGNYKVIFNDDNYANGTLCLIKRNFAITADGNYPVAWNNSDTGKLKVNVTGINLPLSGKTLFMDNMWINLMNGDELTISNGSYNVDAINIKTGMDNDRVEYDFWKRDNNVINVTGNEQSLNFDLGINEINLDIYSNNIRPGEPVKFGVNLKTNSGYNLEWSNRYIGMDISIATPNGDTKPIGNYYFRNGDYWLPNDAPKGEYKLMATVDFGALCGVKNIEKPFVVGTPYLTFDKDLLRVGELATVKLKACYGENIPYANAWIELFGPGLKYSGRTDDNGEVTFTFTPDGDGNIDAKIEGYYLSNQLFVVRNDQGVVKVTARDKQNNMIRNFDLKVISNNDDRWTNTSEESAAVIANQGACELLFANQDNWQNSYYVVKNITVIPGIVNNIEIDMNTEPLVQADFAFNYAGFTTGAYSVELENQTTAFGRNIASVGSTDNSIPEVIGNKRVFVTPGSYRVIFHSYVDSVGYMCLTKNISINESKVYPVSWAANETARIMVNIKGNNIEPKSIRLFMDDMTYYLQGSKEIVVNKGQHRLQGFSIETIEDNKSRNYDFKNDNPALIDVSDVYNLDLDISISNVSLKIFSDNLKPGEGINFGVDVLTNSGYRLEWSNDYIGMNVEIQRPDGKFDYLENQYFRKGWYRLPFNLEGQYNISAHVNLGTVFGEQDASTSFYVAARPTVTLSSICINVGENAAITVTVTDQQDQPLANRNVRIGNIGEATTNENGCATITVNSQWWGNIPVYVDNYEYRDMLFAIDDYHRVLEVKFNDILGNEFKDFEILLRNNENNSKAKSENGIARTVVPKGQNLLVISARDYITNEGYYIIKTVGITDTPINSITVSANDAANPVIKADLQFTLDGKPINNCGIRVEKLGEAYDYMDQYLDGPDSNGLKTIYMTPGTYRISIDRDNSEYSKMYLSKEITITSTGTCQVSWNSNETGILKLNVSGLKDGQYDIGININKQWIWSRQGTEIILNSGNYKLLEVQCVLKEFNNEVRYSYWKPEDAADVLNIGNSILSHNLDLSIEYVNININGSTVLHPGEEMYFNPEPATKSGYIINWIQNFNSKMYVKILNPNQQEINFEQDFRKGNYKIGSNDPSGEYTLTAHVDLGPAYGTSFDPSTKFYVLNDYGFRVISVSPGVDAVNVPVDGGIVLVFSRIIKSVGWNGIVVKDSSQAIIPIRDCFVYNNVVNIVFESKLKYDTKYTVTIIKDLVKCEPDGQTIPENFVFSFTTSPAPSLIYGDVNNDGVINDTDCTHVKNQILNRDELLTPDGKAAADVDGDGKITSTDYALILRYLRGKITKFPVEP